MSTMSYILSVLTALLKKLAVKVGVNAGDGRIARR